MKTLTLIIALFIYTFSFAQNFVDNQGIPTDKPVEQFLNTKNVVATEQTTILNTFVSPTNLPTDITSDANYIYVVGYNEYVIFVLDKITGAQVSTIAIDIQRPYGLTIEGDYIYVLDNNNNFIEEIDLLTGTVLRTIQLCSTGDTYPTGLVIAEGNFWMNDAIGSSPTVTGDTTLNMDINGICFDGYNSHGDYPTGMAWDGEFLYSTDNVNQIIYEVDPTNFEVLASYDAPGGNYPNGLSFDGTDLWLINNSSDSIYQIQGRQMTTNILANNIENELSIYPNPTNGNATINIYLPTSSDVSIEILDISGKVIDKLESNYYSQGNNKIVWSGKQNNPNISAGMYFVKAEYSGSTQMKKLIIN